MDEHWERLLPSCLNKKDKIWFVENLQGQGITWSEAHESLLNYDNPPVKRFMLMAECASMRQSKQESTREYAAKFQRLRKKAGMKDGIQLIMMFFCSLKVEIREKVQPTVAHYLGTRLSTGIKEIMDIISATTDKSDLCPLGDELDKSSKANDYCDKDNYYKGHKRHRRSSSYEDDSDNISHKRNHLLAKAYGFKNKLINKKETICQYCSKPWFQGHNCAKYKNNISTIKSDRISRINSHQ